jgi:hypothetical protein
MGQLGGQYDSRDTGVKVNTDIFGWLRLLVFAGGAFYLWRSALFPAMNEPRKRSDRALRLIGAGLLTVVVIYFVGYGLGLYSN